MIRLTTTADIAGIFERVSINVWQKVLPKVQSGELVQANESEN